MKQQITFSKNYLNKKGFPFMLPSSRTRCTFHPVLWMGILLVLFYVLMASFVLADTYSISAPENDTYSPPFSTESYQYTAASVFCGNLQAVGERNRLGYFRWKIDVPPNSIVSYAIISVNAYDAAGFFKRHVKPKRS